MKTCRQNKFAQFWNITLESCDSQGKDKKMIQDQEISCSDLLKIGSDEGQMVNLNKSVELVNFVGKLEKNRF